MMQDTLGMVLLLLTGIVALLYGGYMIKRYMDEGKLWHLYWGISYLVLFVSGVLIILFDFDVLSWPLVPAVAALIPAGIAIGLLYFKYTDSKAPFYYLIYAIVIIVLIAIIQFVAPDYLSIFVMLIHIPSGLIISFFPMYLAFNGDVEWPGYILGLGGIFMSLGGVLLAFLKAGSPILTADQIFAVLPGLLLIVGILFTIGFYMEEKWK